MSSFQMKKKRNQHRKSMLWLVMDLDHIFRRQYVGLQSYHRKIDPETYHQGYQWEDDIKFLAELKRQIQSRIKKLISIQRANPNRVILMTDDIQSENTDWIWRAEVWPNWAQKFQNEFYSYRQGPVWNKIFSEGLLTFFEREKYTYFRIPDFEADDIIAIITKSILKKYPNDRIQIISNDSDFYQLISPNVQVVNVLGEEETSKFFPSGKENLWYSIIGGRLSNRVPALRFRVDKLKEFLGIRFEEDSEELEPIGEYRRLTRAEQQYCVENLEKFFTWLVAGTRNGSDTGSDTDGKLVENNQHLINEQVLDFNLIPSKYVTMIQHHFWSQYDHRDPKEGKTMAVVKEEKKQPPRNPFAALAMSDSDSDSDSD